DVEFHACGQYVMTRYHLSTEIRAANWKIGSLETNQVDECVQSKLCS
ncbi:hypothetical protein DBR06_SOUSAS24210005, partial [Sousa chinensis]